MLQRFKHYFSRLLLGSACLICGSAAMADYADEWGPAVGTPAPAIEAQDQTGAIRRFEDLRGEHGLLLFMNRSADW